MTTFDSGASAAYVGTRWAEDLVPTLERYITIPALSPNFDPDWVANGHLEAAVDLVYEWMAARPIAGMVVEIHRLEGRTPVVMAEIPAFDGDSAQANNPADPTVLLYGHLDKQPEMEGWRPGFGPWTPVMEGTRLFGRGGADDGYSAFASLTAIEAVQRVGGSHGRCVILIEASEESGSPDLGTHVEALADRLGTVELIVCLDSGCLNYETLWLTTSLRGMVAATVRVDVLVEGVHSGSAGGLAPSSMMIMRQLLDRLEDASTGAIGLEAATVEIPRYRIDEAEATAKALAAHPADELPFLPGVQPMVQDPVQALLARTWRPSLAYTGVDGMPSTGRAGNVLRPGTALKLSFRLPPTADSRAVVEQLKTAVETDPPFGATITVSEINSGDGWNAPDLEPWLRQALDQASINHFGQPIQLFGEGGTIPFMGMLGERFPRAQFVVTGVLGPGSNAHGPNEFLDVVYAEKLTACLADVLVAANGVNR